MPRKAAGEPAPTETKTTKAKAAEAPPAEPKVAGHTTTRTGAEALNIETDAGIRTFTAGGEKGQHIADLLKKGGMTRKQIAEAVGCSQSRVSEVARVLGLTTTKKPRETADA